MQVQSRAPAGAAVGRPDVATPARGPRPRRRFGDGEGDGAELAPLPAGGPLGLRDVATRVPGPQVSCAEAAVDRVLVGATPGAADVRLGVGAGPLAGVEVRLVMSPQGIEVAFLAADVGTRRMLAGVAAELQRRLEARGRRIARVGVIARAAPEAAAR